MQKPSFLLLALVTGLCFWVSSCKYSNRYVQVNAQNKFLISVPPWMKEQNNLKPGAEFQYANRFRNFYAIGTADDKLKLKRTLPEAMNDNLEILKKAMKNPVVSDSVEVNTGGLKGARVELFGKMNNENIYFSEVLLEGKTRLYHLSVWTRGDERKLKFKDDINQILDSFREIQN